LNSRRFPFDTAKDREIEEEISGRYPGNGGYLNKADRKSPNKSDMLCFARTKGCGRRREKIIDGSVEAWAMSGRSGVGGGILWRQFKVWPEGLEPWLEDMDGRGLIHDCEGFIVGAIDHRQWEDKHLL
jgi:hypothetical protein